MQKIKNIIDKENKGNKAHGSRNLIRILEIEAAKEIVEEVFAVMDGVEGLVYVSDMKDYTLLCVNKHVKELYGKNIVGKKCYNVLHEYSERPCNFCTNDLLLKKGKPCSPVIWDFHNTGTDRWYHCIDRAIRWPTNRFVRLEVAFDITDIKKSEIALRASESFHTTIFESIQDPFCIIRHDYRFTKTNEFYARMREKTVDQLVGNRCFEVLYNRRDICNDCVVRETFQTETPQMKEKLTTFSSGVPVWVEIHTYPIFDENGKVTNVIEYTRDTTALMTLPDY
jgi:PAS domain S-box-containing protein